MIVFPGRDALVSQLKNIRTAPTGDNDNYGSIYLYPTEGLPADVLARIPVEARTRDIDSAEVLLLPHAVSGMLCELEIVKAEGTNLLSEIEPEDLEVQING